MKLNKKLITLVLALSMFLWSFSAGIVNISLPSISQYLDVSTNLISLIVIMHLLVLTCFLLIFGRIGDIIGHKKVYLSGIFIFAFCSYFCFISIDIIQLIIFRILLGIGSAMMISMVPAITSITFPHNERGKIFGFISVTTALGLASGYGIGGFIVENIGWNYIFLAVFPIALINLILAHKVLSSNNQRTKDTSFDLVGALLIFFAILTLILPFNVESNFNMSMPIIISTFLISILLIIIFFIWESKCEDPLFDISILKNLNITFSLIAAFLASLILTGTIYLIPFYFQLIMKYSSNIAGFVILIPSLTVLFIGPLSGHISDNIGTRKPLILACLCLIIATILLYLFNETVSMFFIIITLGVRALSDGMFTPAISKLIMSHSPKNKVGSVSSLLNSSKYLGLVMGVVIFNLIFNYTISNQVMQLTGIPSKGAFQLSAPTEILLNGFHNAFFIGIVLSILILLLCFNAKEKDSKVEESEIYIPYD